MVLSRVWAVGFIQQGTSLGQLGVVTQLLIGLLQPVLSI